MRASLFVALITLTATQSGCALYFDDDDPDPCVDFGGGAEVPAVGQRNPQTGVCEYFGGGSFPCDPECGPCPGGPESDQAQPSWGYCESECSFLDETTCQETSGCRAVYIDHCTDDPCTTEPTFSECWSVDMTGPIQGGGCDGLDAFTCSQHDDCVAVHADSCGGGGDGLADPACVAADFLRCGDEPNRTGAGNCYDEVTCDEAAPECPPETLPGVLDGCYTGFCIPLDQCEAAPACDTVDETTCVGRADCAPSYRGVDCICDVNGCTCASFEFTGCDAL